MDARHELRAALAAQHLQDNARALEEAELAESREQYEQDEQAVTTQLHQAADLTLQAMSQIETERIAFTPRLKGLAARLKDPQKHVVGWEVSLQDVRYILCPDGTLIRPQLNLADVGPHQWTLWDWIDLRVRHARDATPSKEYASEWEKAFLLLERRDRGAARAAMRSRLERTQKQVTKMLAGVLRDYGLSI
jgi:hypothetical protein